jgi:uncharacterized membrane protein YjgN (DUF898 family)
MPIDEPQSMGLDLDPAAIRAAAARKVAAQGPGLPPPCEGEALVQGANPGLPRLISDDAPLEDPLPLRFTGTASGYFHIWAVGLLLSIATLGVYSAWAKVRRLRYLYAHTELDGVSFAYHADPLIVLRGRAIAVALFASLGIVQRFDPAAGAIATLALALLWPMLLVRSYRFRLANTSYRGLRFAFDGNVKQAYALMGWFVLGVVTLGILYPDFRWRWNLFVARHRRYGSSPFECDAPWGQFYSAQFGTVFLVVAVMAIGVTVAMLAPRTLGPDSRLGGWLMFFSTYVIAGIAYVYLDAATTNAIWSRTRIAGRRFSSALRFSRLAWLYASGTVAILCTLGMAIPWASMRIARYRASALAVERGGGFEGFTAGAFDGVGAAGGEMVDWLGSGM